MKIKQLGIKYAVFEGDSKFKLDYCKINTKLKMKLVLILIRLIEDSTNTKKSFISLDRMSGSGCFSTKDLLQ